jgi:hypothetical protein
MWQSLVALTPHGPSSIVPMIRPLCPFPVHCPFSIAIRPLRSIILHGPPSFFILNPLLFIAGNSAVARCPRRSTCAATTSAAWPLDTSALAKTCASHAGSWARAPHSARSLRARPTLTACSTSRSTETETRASRLRPTRTVAHCKDFTASTLR